VQVTQDLASFWARGYHDVKKDLKGRYPNTTGRMILCSQSDARANENK